MRRLALAPILVCALLSPSTALALGVGDIELQSALNQPLDAEIPLRGVSSEESDDIVVTLASEQAFREVGLERPFYLTRLEFDVASRDGSHYIQISSHEPITEPFLSFLIEVDSSQGNLLREYTVLLDPPVFASEEGGSATDEGSRQQPARGEADEPAGATGAMADGEDMTGRLADSDTDTDTAGGRAASSDDTEAPSTGAGQQRSGQFGDTPMFLRIAREEETAERQLAEQAAQRKREAAAAERERARAESAPAPSGRTMSGDNTSGTDSGQTARTEQSREQEEYGPVGEGETLWGIAERLKRGEVTTQQMMLALLRYNPEAFESNNVNRLKQGYVLRVPEADEVRSISAQQAIAQVRDQNGLWREWRDSLQQGDATQVAAAEQPQGTEDTSGATDSERGDAGAGSAAGTDDSRLDIVGADEGGATSDESASATSSNASGTREQLQLAREELASVRSEKEELSERVEQLESTVDKMEQLVTVREQQLAQLERQLADLREQTGQSGDTAPATADAGDGTQGEQEDASTGAAEAAGDEEGDMMVADAAGDSGDGDGSTTASGDSGGGDAADDPAAGEGTTGDQADAGERSGADGGGAGGQTTASDQQRETVNPADDAQQQERGWLDAALGFLASIGATVSGAVSGLAGGSATSLPVIGGAGLAVLALVLLAVRRRRAAQAAADEELMGPVAVGEHHADTEPMGLGADDSPSSVEASAPAAESPSQDNAGASLMDDELDLSGLDVDPEAATPGDEAEQDDTLVEADTYLAYGLHQQAEDLLRLALEEQPDRLDYREKLLETLSAAGKGDEFVSTAEDFHERLGGSSDPAWQRVSAMGRKIAPDHALFAAGAAAAGGAAMAASDSGTDDDFAFDLDSESPVSSGDEPPAGAEADLDLGETTSATTASADSGGSDDLTFDLSDLEDSTPAAEPATEANEGPAAHAGADDGGLDFDLGDFDLGDGSPSTTASAGDEPSTGAASAPDDDGLDLDLGDLGIDDSTSAAGSDSGAAPAQGEGEIDLSDFDDLDLGSDSSDPATETATAATGEGDLSFDLDESTSSDSSGLEDFDLGDPSSDTTEATGGVEGAETSASESTTASGEQQDPFGGLDDLGGDADSEEFDLSSLEQELTEPDAPQPAAASTADGGAAPVGEADDLATMLDLAKAYIDMGDAESASNALEEVIAGGTEEQRAEARSLLETVQ